jgi:hypothetical protein
MDEIVPILAYLTIRKLPEKTPQFQCLICVKILFDRKPYPEHGLSPVIPRTERRRIATRVERAQRSREQNSGPAIRRRKLRKLQSTALCSLSYQRENSNPMAKDNTIWFWRRGKTSLQGGNYSLFFTSQRRVLYTGNPEIGSRFSKSVTVLELASRHSFA